MATLDEVGATEAAGLVLHALHEEFRGDAPKVALLLGLKSPRMMRGMLTGEKNLSLVRLLAIGLSFPERFQRPLQVLNQVLGYETPTPSTRAVGSIDAEIADLGPEFGALVSDYAAAKADGYWSYDDVDGLLRRLDRLMSEAVELRAALKRELGLAGVREGIVHGALALGQKQ